MNNEQQLRNASQLAEYNTAKRVIVCEPTISMEINVWHPRGNLYEVPVSTEKALQEHRNYQQVMRNYGIDVIEVQKTLAEKCDIKILRELAFQELKYVSIDNKESYYTSDEYKQKVINTLSRQELLRIVMMRPTIKLQSLNYNTGCIAVGTEIKPIGNMVFTRDQQITTDKGIILTNFTAEQRRKENSLMKIFWNSIGYNVLGQTEHVMEGGDFVILDNETQLLGCGLRTSYASGLEIMNNGWVGTKYFVIVKDSTDQDQDRMHLDCVFSPLHEKLVVIDETITKQGNQRFVDEYINTPQGYKLNQANIEFTQYLKNKNVQIITLTHEQQLAYGCNSLNLGLINGQIQVLCAHEESANYIKSTEIFKNYCKQYNVNINVQYIPFRGITSMYGCLHCASQVVERDNSNVHVSQISETIENKVKQDGVILIPNFTNHQLAVKMEQKYNELTKEGKNLGIISQHVDTKVNSLEEIKGSNNFVESAQEYYDMKESKKQCLSEEDCILFY